MLQCGQPGITVGECRVNLALWSLAKSPLLIGADVRGFGHDIIALLTNHEVLAVNQDAAGVQGRLVATADGNQTQIWAGPLAPKGGLAGGRHIASGPRPASIRGVHTRHGS